MDSHSSLGSGFQLPLHRRLSRLYNDTKKSSDFVTQPVQNVENPEMRTLHRKLRIQKDRFVSWGLEWSDPAHSAELSEQALSKAGLSEVVGSIISTIKETLAEAEPLWHSYMLSLGGGAGASRTFGDKKIRIVSWDAAEFEGLLRDLTTSIDTLYELSRKRSSSLSPSQSQKMVSTQANSKNAPAFESARFPKLRNIDPRDLLMPPITGLDLVDSTMTGTIVFLSRKTPSGLNPQKSRESQTPLLLEYAGFKRMYSTTGILPSLSRLEKLSAGLQMESIRTAGPWIGLPRLVGQFEDMERSRMGLVYQFPSGFNPLSYEHLTQDPIRNLCTLKELILRSAAPKLEARLRLASNLANTVFEMHARGIIHGFLHDENISFCNANGADQTMGTGEFDIRRPLISAFELFDEDPGELGYYSMAHRVFSRRDHSKANLPNKFDSKTNDLYTLGLLLLSIGLWEDVAGMDTRYGIKDATGPAIEHLAAQCGTLYMKAVHICCNTIEIEQALGEHAENRIQAKIIQYLETCCVLDSVDDVDFPSEGLGIDARAGPRFASLYQGIHTQTTRPSSHAVATDPVSVEPPIVPRRSQRSTQKASQSSFLSETMRKERASNSSPGKSDTNPDPAVVVAIESANESPPQKLRLFPHIPLPINAVDDWNKVVMPQINEALRGFYRYHPESVEISLESIGYTATDVRPTVLIICTSVNKVRSILHREAGPLFEGAKGYTLKVCRGQVLRSGGRQYMSMTEKLNVNSDSDHSDARNYGYQQRPKNGASIGAWIGDRHLPPVSFGGLVVIEGKTYGMTVHHMLDDPDSEGNIMAPGKTTGSVKRSVAGVRDEDEEILNLDAWYAQQYGGNTPSDDADCPVYAAEFSDDESEAMDAESELASIYGAYADDHLDEGELSETGDRPGVEPSCGDDYIVSQPAMDDVADGFYLTDENKDSQHLASCRLGRVYASSGIRRREDEEGLIHEIDWALFEFDADRLPPDNCMPHAKKLDAAAKTWQEKTSTSHVTPRHIIDSNHLPNLAVQCVGRTSGLQTGVILPVLTSVKLFGRSSPSHSYQVSADLPRSSALASIASSTARSTGNKSLPLGIPGDSGAWVVEREHGHVCGHVLAWSERKRVAYICPMSVLLADIAETLGVDRIRLPGAVENPQVSSCDREDRTAVSAVHDDARGFQEVKGGVSEDPGMIGGRSPPKSEDFVYNVSQYLPDGDDNEEEVAGVPARRSMAMKRDRGVERMPMMTGVQQIHDRIASR